MTITSCASAAKVGSEVCVLVEERYLTQDQPAGVVQALRSRGVRVRTVVAEAVSVDLSGGSWTRGSSVVLARGRSDALIGLLRSAEQSGVPVVNTAMAIQAVVDKAGLAATLSAAGVPTPTSWLGSPTTLARRDDLPFPLILKPVLGDNARGLVVVESHRGLQRVTWTESVALAQEFHRGDGSDLKLYVAGRAVWAVRRPSPIERDGSPRVARDPGVPVLVTPLLRSLAWTCARLFGLRLFGVDCVLGPEGLPLVIEVNDYPNYRGLPAEANHVLADIVLARAASATQGTEERVSA
jgi:glutathione synthase/RimK-type ligase-like ATP-grasp enzyme